MERAMFKYVYNFFHSNDLFYKYQAGFFSLGVSLYINSLGRMITLLKPLMKEHFVVWYFAIYQKHLIGIRD